MIHQPNSSEIKLALMKYYRFDKQMLCATECLNGDVVAASEKFVFEVEIKIDAYDITREKLKPKHIRYKNPNIAKSGFIPNKFLLCVPDHLEVKARSFIAETNPRYGLLSYSRAKIITVKKPALLSAYARPEMLRALMMRVCCENINHIDRKLKKETVTV